MYKIACSNKELSCLISNLFSELIPVCDECIKNINANDNLILKGKVIGTDEEATIIITDYGCNYYGDIEHLKNIREKRCLLVCSH